MADKVMVCEGRYQVNPRECPTSTEPCMFTVCKEVDQWCHDFGAFEYCTTNQLLSWLLDGVSYLEQDKIRPK